MTNEREPHDSLPSPFDEDDDGAEIRSDGADAANTPDPTLPSTFSPRRARREQGEPESTPKATSATPLSKATSSSSTGQPSSNTAPSSSTAPSRLASEAKFAWGLTPRVPASSDEAADRSRTGADAAASVEPGTPTENDVPRDSPAVASRPFYPPPSVRSSEFDAPVATPKDAEASGERSMPKPVTPGPVTSDPATSDVAADSAPVDSTPADSAPADSSPPAIPTLEQVLDAPSPRRAAREAAAREEAARAASAAPQAVAGIPPLTEPAIEPGRVRAPEIDPNAADPASADNSSSAESVGQTQPSEFSGSPADPRATTSTSGLEALFGTAPSGPIFGDPDGSEGLATGGTTRPASETTAGEARGRRFDQAEREPGDREPGAPNAGDSNPGDPNPGDPKPPMATRQKVLIGVVLLLLVVLVVVVLLAVGRMSTTTAALVPTFGWASSTGLPPVWLAA